MQHMDKQTTTLLVTPPAEVMDFLSREEGVATGDVVGFLQQLAGLTEDQGIALLNRMTFDRSWNMATHLACAEGLDYARPPASLHRCEAEQALTTSDG